ncbi:hypothetical protein Sango_3048800 [Sesamum angolense]|uniref:Reverse transcriptase domain-containing protein n=1 Tax=Sesamum angolense TaxID=2727404 RepID=A0AAE1TC85_9LAMI|nr:hypothetical protein Sango_3048800 [Sesamum angolense]
MSPSPRSGGDWSGGSGGGVRRLKQAGDEGGVRVGMAVVGEAGRRTQHCSKRHWNPTSSLRNGKEDPKRIDVEYEWLPQRCKNCCSLGHATATCPANMKKKVAPPITIFVKKQTPQPDSTQPEQCLRSLEDHRPSTSSGSSGSNKVEQVVRDHKLSFLGLVETRVSQAHVQRTQRHLLNNWSWFEDYSGPAGRTWIAWNPLEVDVVILEDGSQFIHCRAFNKRLHTRCLITVVYGAYDIIPRRDLWGTLRTLSKGISDEPWLVLGDFNAVIDNSEVCGQAADTSASMADFRNCVRDTGLVQLPFTGCPFTWHNCSEGPRSLWRRLDRMLVNVAWLDAWPGSSYISALPSTSDHSPLILTGMDRITDHAIFRFDNYLAQVPGFLDSVQSIWKHRITGTTMYAVAKLFLNKAQAMFDKYKEDIFLNLVKYCRRVYATAVKLEISMLQQRAKLRWLKHGDQNSKVFFRKINSTRVKQRVFQITMASGDILTAQHDVTQEFIMYFQNLLGGSSTHRVLDLGFLRHDLKHSITTAEANLLVAPVTHLEVKEAFFDIEVESAPGLDGYTSAFYRAAWPVVGQIMFEAVGEFFRMGKILKQINTTLLALIPKVNMPTYVSDYRPISCCNLLYKAITKILVKRLQRVLPLLIDYSQNAFVPGRSISDIILLAQELLASYNQTRLPARCMLKVDIQKAYDSVEWDFLLEAHIPSIKVLTDTLSEFATLSGLKVNPAKSQTILSRAVQQERQQILESVGFQEGSLPVKYLGVLKLLEKKMRAFLWQGSSGSRNAKVAWDQLCKPKAEGGLGIRSLIITNQALILKQLWRILQNDGTSIWVDWIQQYRLRHTTLWTFNRVAGSWGWKKMLKLRPILQRGVIYKVGDGSSFSLWQDIWHDRGPLCLNFPCGPEVTGLPLTLTLSSVLQHNRWSWPASTDNDITEIMSQLPPTYPSAADTICWRSTSGSFTIKTAILLIQPSATRVHWQGLLQGKFKIARHGFILWLAILEKLSTMDKPWVPGEANFCVLCGGQFNETHDHLFFNCWYSKRCLTILKTKIKFQWPYLEWQRGITWASKKWRGDHLVNAALRATLVALIYRIWAERNIRKFIATTSSAEITSNKVLEDVRMRIMSANISPRLQTTILYRIWNLAWPFGQ